ncbi:hypothetical protein F4703DRAFT_1819813 [Phycomyces blakesleeanus]
MILILLYIYIYMSYLFDSSAPLASPRPLSLHHTFNLSPASMVIIYRFTVLIAFILFYVFVYVCRCVSVS